MITTVTLNPCMDRTLYLDSFKAGGLNMARKSRLDISGKGLNVSEVLRMMGLSTMCLGIIFDENGGRFSRYLDERCIAHDFVSAKGQVRTNIKLVSADSGEMTEINSYGEPVEPAVVEAFLKKLELYAGRSSVIAFCGRVPNGGGFENYEDIYRRSIGAVKGFDLITAVDAEKEPLRQAALAKPYLIKPNLYELETAFGCKTHSTRDVADACRDIIKKGVAVVCCSMGGGGAVIADKASAYFAPAVDVAAAGLQGAGDSLMAGLLGGLRKRLGLQEMLRCGVAAASGTVTREGAQLCRRRDYDEMLKKVSVQAIVRAIQ